MGSVPKHPFFLKVIDSLPRYDRNWFLPYITVMGSTGPLFLSIIWRHYSNQVTDEEERVRILFPDEYSKHSWSFFRYHIGNSWHQKDVQLILWVCIPCECFLTLTNSSQMSRHWILLTACGFFAAAIVFSTLWWLYGRILLSPTAKAQSYRRRARIWRKIKSFGTFNFAKKEEEPLDDYEKLLRRYNETRLEA
jgi:hypothetical protein